MRRHSVGLLLGLLISVTVAFAKISVVASLPDLASIAAFVGGNRVEVMSIARPTADPHRVEVLPSYMVRVSRADLYLQVGLGLDQWAESIIDGSRNARLRVVDCSRGIAVREKPTGEVNASQGDVHPGGNPHYWLDPSNGVIIAQTVAEAMVGIDPAGRDVYAANLTRFTADLNTQLAEWRSLAASLTPLSMVTYHSSWTYLAAAFDFKVAAKIEPFPGIPPTGRDLAKLVELMRAQNIRLIIREPYFSDDGPNYLERQTGAKVVTLAPSCSDVTASSYFDHFQSILTVLKAAVQ